MPYKNGWTDSRSYISRTQVNGVQKISGSYWHNNVEFRFSLREQGQISTYPYRGHISLIGPDGKIMQMRGKLKRERLKKIRSNTQDTENTSERRHEELNLSSNIYLASDNEQKIQEIIAEKAQMLYGRHIYTITDSLRERGAALPLTFALAVQLYASSFIKADIGRVSPKTIRGHENTLVRIGAILDECAMAEIEQKHIRRLHQQLGSISGDRQDEKRKLADDTIRRKINLASRFWQYCREKGLFQAADNPFSEYTSNTFSNRPDTAKLQQAAMTAKVLSGETERKINHILESNIADGRYMGIAVIKDAHFASADACALSWSDIIFDDTLPDFVRISQQRDSIAGATHDFTRPCFPFCGLILRKRYDYLLSRYTAIELQNMPVVSAQKDPKKGLKGKDLTAFCMNILKSSGISNAQLEKLRQSSQTGVGVRLIMQNYKYKLSHFCGLSEDPAAMSFLMGLSMQADTTGNHYRSFTAPEGQRYLYVALCRDTRFKSYAENHRTQSRKPGQIIFRPGQPDKIIVAAVSLQIKKGETIEIHASKGVKGNMHMQPLQLQLNSTHSE